MKGVTFWDMMDLYLIGYWGWIRVRECSTRPEHFKKECGRRKAGGVY
jgi:hypothetical protein